MVGSIRGSGLLSNSDSVVLSGVVVNFRLGEHFLSLTLPFLSLPLSSPSLQSLPFPRSSFPYAFSGKRGFGSPPPEKCRKSRLLTC